MVSALTPGEQRRLQKFVKPFLEKEWTSTNGGLLCVKRCDDTGAFHVSPASDPQSWSSFALSTVGESRTLHLVRPDGSQWKFEPGESNFGSGHAVWSGPPGASPTAGKEAWTCRPREQPSTEEGEAEFQAGQLAMHTQDFNKAVQHFDAVISLHDSYEIRALRARAKAQLLLGAFDEALVDAQAAQERDEHCVDSHFTLGLVKMIAKDFLGACISYRRALDISPGLLCVLEGLCEAERLLLTSVRLESVAFTYKPDSRLDLKNVWDMAARGSASGTPIRQVAMMFHSSTSSCPMPYLLTLPLAVVNGVALQEETTKPDAAEQLFPLALYLHSAAFTDLVKGDVQGRQLQLLGEEAPQSLLLQKGHVGSVDSFIGLAPCCPPNVALLDPLAAGKESKKRKVFWFKTCDAQAYFAWSFAAAQRCLDVEVLVVELLHQVCAMLPVDPQRIYFLGSSCGGYAALRLAELVPNVPAAVVPFAGYYPDMPGQDHDTAELVSRLRGVNIWPLHCKDDKLCRLHLPMVQRLYQLLGDQKGMSVDQLVDWVPNSVAKGSQSNYHSAYNQLLKDPEHFFRALLSFSRTDMQRTDTQSPLEYLGRRWAELAELLRISRTTE